MPEAISKSAVAHTLDSYWRMLGWVIEDSRSWFLTEPTKRKGYQCGVSYLRSEFIIFDRSRAWLRASGNGLQFNARQIRKKINYISVTDSSFAKNLQKFWWPFLNVGVPFFFWSGWVFPAGSFSFWGGSRWGDACGFVVGEGIELWKSSSYSRDKRTLPLLPSWMEIIAGRSHQARPVGLLSNGNGRCFSLDTSGPAFLFFLLPDFYQGNNEQRQNPSPTK